MTTNELQVVFDLDGTIIDSAPAILECFRETVIAGGIEPTMALDNSLIGPPLTETMALISGLDDAQRILLLAEDFKHRYDEGGFLATRAYAGVEEVLERLKAAGCGLHIATNKRLRPTERILDNLDLSRYFDSIYAIDLASPPYRSKAEMIAALMRDRNLNPGVDWYVGDRMDDGLAADANELPFVAVNWGYGDWAALTLKAHWRLVSAPDELADCVLRLRH